MRTNPSGKRPSRWLWLALPAALLLLTLHVRADGSLANLDHDNGLPDAQLGTASKNVQGLKKTEDMGRFQTYIRPSDRMQLEGVDVTGITYNFFKDELYSIDIDIVGAGNVHKLLRVLEERYGKDYSTESRAIPKNTAQLEIREWTSKRAYCLYKSASDGRGATLVYVNRPKWDELEVPRRDREKQSREMLKGSFMNGDF